MARALYELTADLSRLNDLLDDVEGDLSRLGEMEPAVTAWFDAVGEEQAVKFDSFIHLIRLNQMEATAAKAEEEQYAAKRKARESRVRYLEAKLKAHLEATNQTKVQTASGRVVSIQKNGGVAPLEIKAGTDPEAIPAEYVRTVVEIDKAKVRAALEAGKELEFAELLPRGTSLRVK
jgi:hypothetical protein